MSRVCSKMGAVPSRGSCVGKLQDHCREFYYGSSKLGEVGRYVLLGTDILIVFYFIVTTFLPGKSWLYTVDVIIGVYLIAELAGRVIADSDRIQLLSRPLTLLDTAIIVSLFLPGLFESFAFMRVIRAMRIMRSYIVVSRLQQKSGFFARNEDVIFSAVNLLVFIFVVTAFVYVLQVNPEGPITNYIDALYFTIATLTTTGFGDVTLQGNTGHMLAIIIMIVGVALFLRLVQTIFRPHKVRYECPDCGLMRHDLDAVHCKHCGRELHIRTEGIS